jgi:hypothetical protein
LRDAQIVVGIIGRQVRELLIDSERVREFLLGHQSLAEPAKVAQLRGIQVDGFAVSLFGLGEIFGLCVGVAQQVEKGGGRSTAVHAFEERDSFGRFAFVEKELGELLDRLLVLRVILEDATKNGFGLVVLVAQAVEACEP